MQELLHIKLHDYLAVHYPDMLLGLREQGKEETYIQEKVAGISGDMEAMLAGDTPAYMVEIHCMDVLISSLGPSRYDYICNILEEEFAEQFAKFEQYGITLYEVINIIIDCGEALNDFDEDDRLLRYHVMGTIDRYFNNPQTAGYGV